jgi:hypothetical protein
MRKPLFFCLLSVIIALSCTIPIHADVVWPALLLGGAIFSSSFLVIISIIIEGFILCLWLPNISYQRGLWISCIGNLASTIVGTILTVIISLVWQIAFDIFFIGALERYNYIISYILMYLGSCAVELIAIKKFFHYTSKEVLVPVLIGNLVTYALVVLYQCLYLEQCNSAILSVMGDRIF